MKKRTDQVLLILLVLTALLLLVIPGFDTPVGTAAETTSPEAETAAPIRVEQILEQVPLSETALPDSVYDPELHASGNAPGLGSGAYGYELAQYCAATPINPVAGFMELVRPDMYSKTETDAGMLRIPLYDAFGNPVELKNQELSLEPESYPFSEDGAHDLVSELLRVSEQTGSTMGYGDQFLNFAGIWRGSVHHSEPEGCYYTYFLYYGDATASFVCLYLRSDDGKVITDAELQVLDCDYFSYDVGAGSSLSGENIRSERLRQLASWITALEQVMTGQTRVGRETAETDLGTELRIPFSYELEGCSVTMKQSSFLCDRELGQESAELITYRICK